MVEPIAVTAVLLRAQLPDLTLREGAHVMARVASRGDAHAVLVIAGIPVTAQVPREVRSGATLKLRVQEVTPERVTLQIEQPGVPVAAQPPVDVPPRLVVEEPPERTRGSDGEPADVVAFAFNSPALGRLDLRLELRGDRLIADVVTPPGPAHTVALGQSERLRANLEDAGLRATVSVRPRRTPLDLYA